MINQELSIYIPRVWGKNDDEIRERIMEEMASQGIGSVSRVDIDLLVNNNRQAFVYFDEWLETEENVKLQKEIELANTPMENGEKHPAPRISTGAIGFWLLLKNPTKNSDKPVPREAYNELQEHLLSCGERIMLQSKTIRDLKEALSDQQSVTKRKMTASEEAMMWAKKRRFEGGGESLEELDETVEQMWSIPSKSEEGVFRTVTLYKNGTWNCDCPARKECWHMKDSKQKAAVTEADILRAELEKSQDEIAKLKAEKMTIPPPPPLKRHSNVGLLTHPQQYEHLRRTQEREGLEGDLGEVPALGQFRDTEYVQDAMNRLSCPLGTDNDITYLRMSEQTKAFDKAMKTEGSNKSIWKERGVRNGSCTTKKLLVDARGGEITTALSDDEWDEDGWRGEYRREQKNENTQDLSARKTD